MTPEPKKRPTKRQLKDKTYNALIDVADSLEMHTTDYVAPTSPDAKPAEKKSIDYIHRELRTLIEVINSYGLM